MCCSLRQISSALCDFTRSLREVKTNLSDIKLILDGTLKITRDFEDVTGELKSVVEFYAHESKSALREQLCSTMTRSEKEKLCHRDFLKYFKALFESEISKLIEAHTSFNARVAILGITQYMKDYLIDCQQEMEDSLVSFMLNDIKVYFEESYTMYKRADCVNKENGRAHANILLFCDQQKIIEMLENTLTSHLSDIKHNSYTREEVSREMRYRDRETRIRKLRQYLKDKIKIRKIGNIYREEVSMQINIDLKNAVKKVTECEGLVGEYCKDMSVILQHLPKQRFTEVLREEKMINMRLLLKNLLNTEFLEKENDSFNDSDSFDEEHLEDKKPFQIANISPKEQTNPWKVDENQDKTSRASTILRKTLVVDPELILNDIELLAKPLFEAMAEKSSEYVIQLIDNSNVIASSVIDVLANIETDQSIETNIFMKNLFDLIPLELEPESLRVLESILRVMTYTRVNRKHLMQRVQKVIPNLFKERLAIETCKLF